MNKNDKKPIIVELKDFRHQYMKLKVTKGMDYFDFDSTSHNIFIETPDLDRIEKVERLMCYTHCEWCLYTDRDCYQDSDFGGFDEFEKLNLYIYPPYPITVVRE